VFRIIIAGTRTFDDYALLRKTMCNLFGQVPPSQIEVISGHCLTGADHYGEVFARRNGIRLTLFPADWKNMGRRPALSVTDRWRSMPPQTGIVSYSGMAKAGEVGT